MILAYPLAYAMANALGYALAYAMACLRSVLLIFKLTFCISFDIVCAMKLLTPSEVREILKVSLPTLARWRAPESPIEGPPWIKVGDQIRYPDDELQSWLDARIGARTA